MSIEKWNHFGSYKHSAIIEQGNHFFAITKKGDILFGNRELFRKIPNLADNLQNNVDIQINAKDIPKGGYIVHSKINKSLAEDASSCIGRWSHKNFVLEDKMFEKIAELEKKDTKMTKENLLQNIEEVLNKYANMYASHYFSRNKTL